MKRWAALVGLVAFLFIGVACKDKSPEGVCAHFVKVAEYEGDKAKEEEKECIEELTEMKKELGDEKWDKFATCILDASDKDGARKCEP